MSGKKHHVHANIQRLSSEARRRFESAGFALDPFIPVEGSYAPPIHYSVESDSTPDARTAWNAASTIVDADDDFCGYIEFETLSARFEAVISRSTYLPRRPFPLPELVLSDVPLRAHKAADLHVKRDADAGRDSLDAELTSAGFYEVQTARSRIYTLQCQDARDARAIFSILREFLTVAGGAKQVNFEVVGRFRRKPVDLHLPRFLSRRPDNYWQTASLSRGEP